MAIPASVLLRRGMRRRCPVCAQRGLFRRWVQMVPVCPGCGFTFQRNPGHWLGSWFLSVCLVQTVIVVLLVAEVALAWPGRPPWPALAAVPVAAAVVPLAFFPYSRTLWSAIDLVMRPLDFDEGVAPVVELEQLDALARRARPVAEVTVSRPPHRPGASAGPDGTGGAPGG